MPELPEVETIVRTLEKSLMNQNIQELELYYNPLLEEDSQYPIEALKGLTFKSFDRRGKFLVFGFSQGLYWIVHLRMEGKFYLYQEYNKPNKHCHLIMKLDNHILHYLDVRKFSRMAVTDDPETYFKKKKLGIEPFNVNQNQERLNERLSKSRRAVKASLLDQSIITGIGNIYADEILFLSQIHPQTESWALTDFEIKSLSENIPSVLRKAIQAGGTTIRSYTSALDVSGRFQQSLLAYGRKNEKCFVCSTKMKQVKVAGRTSTYCPTCQKKKVKS